MTLGQAESYSPLINKHKQSISLLRTYIEGLFPDLKANPSLEDGTKVDDLFYLRYVLSAKKPIITNDQVPDSAETKNIIKQLQWRKEQLKLCPSWKSKDYNQVLHPKESQFLSTIPLYRTGELPNQYPVTVLPVRNVDFDTFFRNQENKEFEKELLSFMLVQKERIFREVDAKSRVKSALVKSVTVYDLNGISYSSIYKLTKFFKLVQGQTKIFKAFFPQSTHSTVILNPPGTWMLKMFSKSKKQRVMSLDDFLNEYEARSAVPDFLNGTSPWPHITASSTGVKNNLLIEGEDMESLVSINSLKSADNGMEKNTLSFEELELKRTIHEWSKTESPNKLTVHSSNPTKNVKIALTNLEREMVYMKKNKIFSIDVLGSNQDVNLFFTNLRNKPANILIAVKEEQRGRLYENNTTDNKMYSVVNSSTALKPGLNHFRLHCDNPGEILLIYVSRDKVGKSDVHSIETLDIKKTRKRQVLNYGKKIYKNVVRSPRAGETPIGLSGLNEIPLHAQNPNPSANKFHDKLFFRFEVGDAVMAGNYAGVTSVKESKVQLAAPTKGGRNSVSSVTISRVNHPAETLAGSEKLKYKTRRNKDGLIEFDDRSTLTSSSGGSRNEGFFKAFSQILGLK